MTLPNPTDIGLAVLRVAQGSALFAHGPVLKVLTTGMAFQERIFEQVGYHPKLAWLVLAVEAIAGLMLVLGVQTRLAALAALPIMLAAIGVHAGNGWLFAVPGGGWEYPAFWSAALIAQIAAGGGAFQLWRDALPDPSRLLPLRIAR